LLKQYLLEKFIAGVNRGNKNLRFQDGSFQGLLREAAASAEVFICVLTNKTHQQKKSVTGGGLYRPHPCAWSLQSLHLLVKPSTYSK
jgi:hypothetical protein